jgi:pimeloyl-ACP methyl ester carboxylesterase
MPDKIDFEYINNQHKINLVLIPGWATDSKIFNNLHLPYNLLILNQANPVHFNQTLLTILKDNHIKNTSIAGFSMGGFLAIDFAKENPTFVDNLFLLGIRNKYDAKNIDFIKKLLIRNKAAYLLKFYQSCFNDKQSFLEFKKALFNEYINNFSLDFLLETLDYLSSTNASAIKLKNTNTIFIHGKDDKVAPLNEVTNISQSLPTSKLITLETGHMPFFQKDISEIITNYIY